MIRRALIRADCASTPIIQRFVLRLHSAVIFVQVYAFDDICLYSFAEEGQLGFLRSHSGSFNLLISQYES